MPGDLSIMVEYVDYGNHESLPLNRIRVLDQRFSLFPRQALLCSLAGVDLTLLCCGSGDSSEWCLQVLTWIKSLIFEKPVDLIVYRWLKRNQVEVDVCVPLQALLSSQALSALPSTISADSIVTYTRNKTRASFSLLSVMQSFGLTVPLGTVDDSLTKKLLNQDLNDSEPSVDSGEQICLSLSTPDPLSDKCITKQPPDKGSHGPEALPPMLIQVEESGELTVYVSSVINPGNFYVNPCHESCVQQMNDICNSMRNHFSEGYVQPSQISEDCVGELCCVQSPQDDEWCRGFITDVTKEQGIKKYLVLYIDYGDLQWYVASQLKPFPEDLCQYPAQAVHCSLYDVYPHEEKGGSDDSDHLWSMETIEKFKQLTDSLPHRLVAYVKAQG